MTWVHLVVEALGEFKKHSDGVTPRLNICFLWALWTRLAEDNDVITMVDEIDARFFSALSASVNQKPDSPLLVNLFDRPTADEKLRYLILQTVRTQGVVAEHVNLQIGRTRPVNFGPLQHFPDLPDGFYLLRRRGIPEHSAAALRHRRLPRCLFPDLQIIPTTVHGSVTVELLTCLSAPKARGIEVRPSLYQTPAAYTVSTDAHDDDIYFRFQTVDKGADERVEQFWSNVSTSKPTEEKNDLFLFWPELSIDEKISRQVGRRLTDQIDLDSPQALKPTSSFRTLAIAGTYHVESESLVSHRAGVKTRRSFNRACVWDVNLGELVFSQEKIRPFKINDSIPMMNEALIPATILNVALTEWGTFCVLICKDFVDSRASLVDLLDVDFIIVPCMGDDRTRDAWKRKAEDHKRRWGTRTALALQAPPDLKGWEHVPSDRDQALMV